MERLLDFGYNLLGMAKNASEWLLSPLSDISIPLVWNDINYGSIGVPLDISVADFILGAGITTVLTVKLIKAIVGIVTGS